MPTLGYKVDTLQYDSNMYTFWDIEWGVPLIMRYYYQGTKGIIFTVDSSDKDRLQESSKRLHKILEEDELRGAVVLIFANKQDLPIIIKTSEIIQILGVQSLHQTWNILSCSAFRIRSMSAGLDWISKTIAAKNKLPFYIIPYKIIHRKKVVFL